MTVDAIEIFVEVVAAQSFRRAAERLGMPSTTVSAKLARLEERLGVTLIRRTTRQLHVTPAGQRYYQRCVRALGELEEAERELADLSQEPAGRLRLTVPADLAQTAAPPAIERFLKLYPKVSVELIVTNRRVDLIAEGVDLAIRLGLHDEASLIVRKFLEGRAGLWASPGYLKERGVPKTVADLARHDMIRFSSLGESSPLVTSSGEVAEINFSGRLASDDLQNIRTLIARGNGIGLLPDFLGGSSEGETPLVRVLPELCSDPVTVYFAYPAQRFVPLTVKAFIASATSRDAVSPPSASD
ncbi:LysR family transcriptional regulator [Nisaea sp.]|uniref:LysR family transcriptional regulator n=1 Tax=Nisaea sp. TaxID=2024842 RepID=UPI003265B65F